MPQAKAILHSFQNDTAFRAAKGGENPDRCGGGPRPKRNSRQPACVCSSWATEESEYAGVVALGRPCRCRRRRLLLGSCRALTDFPRGKASRRKLAGSLHRLAAPTRPTAFAHCACKSAIRASSRSTV